MKTNVNIQVLKSSTNLKVLSISGEPGDLLAAHKVNYKALLLMRSGNIIYKEDNRTEVLSAGEYCDIPADTVHKVTCTTHAKFFVVMPDTANLKFEK